MDKARERSGGKETEKKEKPQICFVIMPFGGWFDNYYKAVFCPAIKEAGLIPHRADDLNLPTVIVKDIWNYTKQAEIIIADLTGRNPNVLYELGLAHAIRKPAVLLTQSINDVPFDLQALRVIVYDKNAPDWGEALKASIKQSITEVLKSPRKAVLPAFLEVAETGDRKVTPHDKEMLEIRQEIELMKQRMSMLWSSSIPLSGYRPIPPGIPPFITITPSEGLFGTNVRILGGGWGGNSRVNIVMDGVMVAGFIADQSGMFEEKLDVPQFLGRGSDVNILVEASDEQGNSARTYFRAIGP